MATVEEHYDRLLADVYSWMYGGWDAALARYTEFFAARDIAPRKSRTCGRLGRRLRLPSDSPCAARFLGHRHRPRPQAARRAASARWRREHRNDLRGSRRLPPACAAAGRARRLHGRHVAASRLAGCGGAPVRRRPRGAGARRHVHRDLPGFLRRSGGARSLHLRAQRRAHDLHLLPRVRARYRQGSRPRLSVRRRATGNSRRATTASCVYRPRGSCRRCARSASRRWRPVSIAGSSS